jgi:hypothetical protein
VNRKQSTKRKSRKATPKAEETADRLFEIMSSTDESTLDARRIIGDELLNALNASGLWPENPRMIRPFYLALCEVDDYFPALLSKLVDLAGQGETFDDYENGENFDCWQHRRRAMNSAEAKKWAKRIAAALGQPAVPDESREAVTSAVRAFVSGVGAEWDFEGNPGDTAAAYREAVGHLALWKGGTLEGTKMTLRDQVHAAVYDLEAGRPAGKGRADIAELSGQEAKAETPALAAMISAILKHPDTPAEIYDGIRRGIAALTEHDDVNESEEVIAVALRVAAEEAKEQGAGNN